MYIKVFSKQSILSSNLISVVLTDQVDVQELLFFIAIFDQFGKLRNKVGFCHNNNPHVLRADCYLCQTCRNAD